MKFLKNPNFLILILFLILFQGRRLNPLKKTNLKQTIYPQPTQKQIKDIHAQYNRLFQTTLEIITKYSFVTFLLLPYLFSPLSIFFSLLISFTSYYMLNFYLNINLLLFIPYDFISLYLSCFYLVISISVIYSLSSNMFKAIPYQKRNYNFFFDDEGCEYDCMDGNNFFNFEEFIKVIGLTLLNICLIIIEGTYFFNKSESELVDYGEKILLCIIALVIGIGIKSVFHKKNGMFVLALVFIIFSVGILVNLAGGVYLLIDNNELNRVS